MATRLCDTLSLAMKQTEKIRQMDKTKKFTNCQFEEKKTLFLVKRKRGIYILLDYL